jgi:hypothetical protein
MAALSGTTLAFSYYALSRYPSLHELPFIWVVLLLIEFVISPIHESFFGDLTTNRSHLTLARSEAFVACTLFVLGLWLGLALARRLQRVAHAPARSEPVQFQIATPAAVPLIIGCMTVSLAAELCVLWMSGAAQGDLEWSRGGGLIGTSPLTPLIRLGNVATLLSSYLSIVDPRRPHRRLFGALALGATAAAMVMPLSLGQRFGIMQAIGYLALPRIGAGLWLRLRTRALMLGLLPVALVTGWSLNALSSAVRGGIVSKEGFDRQRLEEVMKYDSPEHFQHLMLLSELIDRGVNEPGFGGLYDGFPMVGDALILLPRVWYPGKPITTMEVVNGVMGGYSYTSLDRATTSCYTASLWVQFYVLGSSVLMLPLSFAFGLLSMLCWGWANHHANSAIHVVLACMLWFTLGWLAFNVALTTIELPGMVLALALLRLFPVTKPCSLR